MLVMKRRKQQLLIFFVGTMAPIVAIYFLSLSTATIGPDVSSVILICNPIRTKLECTQTLTHTAPYP
jgi:hypothetical protein